MAMAISSWENSDIDMCSKRTLSMLCYRLIIEISGKFFSLVQVCVVYALYVRSVECGYRTGLAEG